MELSVQNIVLTAKQHEIQELKHLASRAQLVGVIGHLIHALQSERGASSIYLASAGTRFEATLVELIGASQSIEGDLRSGFAVELGRTPLGTAKLLSLMAWVLLGLDALPDLRHQIAARRLSADEAVAAFSRLIAGLVSLIFEVADAAVEPGISRSLVALFNFIQGKEWAGQERAVGASCFASGSGDGPHQQRILHLIDAQERCFQTFCDFAAPELVAHWQALQVAPCVAQVERMRRILCSAKAGAPLDANLSSPWFEACSERLTAMWTLQSAVVADLQAQCATLIEQAERELLDSEGLLKLLRESPPTGAGAMDRFFDPGLPVDQALSFLPTAGFGSRLGQSIIDVLQAQSERLASMETELETARRALNERKTIERAKGILMARFNLTEEAAFKSMRKAAMDQNRRLVDVAEATLSVPVLGATPVSTHQA